MDRWIDPIFLKGDERTAEWVRIIKEVNRNPQIAESVWILKGGCRDPRTIESVRIFKEERMYPQSADSVRIFQAGCRDLRTAESVRILMTYAGIHWPPSFWRGTHWTTDRIEPRSSSCCSNSCFNSFICCWNFSCLLLFSGETLLTSGCIFDWTSSGG